MAIRALESPKKHFWGLASNYPDAILNSSVDTIGLLASILKELRNIAEVHADNFESEGFSELWTMLKRELSNEYLASIQIHLKELKFRDGVLISAELGKGNKGINHVLRKLEEGKWDWIKRMLPQTTWERVKQVLPQSGPIYSLSQKQRVVGNSVNADEKELVIITGVNPTSNGLHASLLSTNTLGCFERVP
jgi:hypothetical protein